MSTLTIQENEAVKATRQYLKKLQTDRRLPNGVHQATVAGIEIQSKPDRNIIKWSFSVHHAGKAKRITSWQSFPKLTESHTEKFKQQFGYVLRNFDMLNTEFPGLSAVNDCQAVIGKPCQIRVYDDPKNPDFQRCAFYYNTRPADQDKQDKEEEERYDF